MPVQCNLLNPKQLNAVKHWDPIIQAGNGLSVGRSWIKLNSQFDAIISHHFNALKIVFKCDFGILINRAWTKQIMANIWVRDEGWRSGVPNPAEPRQNWWVRPLPRSWSSTQHHALGLAILELFCMVLAWFWNSYYGLTEPGPSR